MVHFRRCGIEGNDLLEKEFSVRRRRMLSLDDRAIDVCSDLFRVGVMTEGSDRFRFDPGRGISTRAARRVFALFGTSDTSVRGRRTFLFRRFSLRMKRRELRGELLLRRSLIGVDRIFVQSTERSMGRGMRRMRTVLQGRTGGQREVNT